MTTDSTALAVFGSTAVVQVDCNPFPTWYDVRPNQNGSFIYGMDVAYGCREDYGFVDGSEDTEKINTCNSDGLWNEFTVCEEILDEEAEELFWTPEEAPGAEYYGYGAITVLCIFGLVLILLDMDIWYYSIKPYLRPIRRGYRRVRRWCRQKCHKEDGYVSDSDDSSSEEDEPVDPVERFKMQFQRNQKIILPLANNNQEKDKLISETSSTDSLVTQNTQSSLKAPPKRVPTIVTTAAKVAPGVNPKSHDADLRNTGTPDIIRDARKQMKMDWKSGIGSPRRERTISVNSTTIRVEVNSPLPGQSSGDASPEPMSYTRRGSIVETSFGAVEKKFPDKLTPPEYSDKPVW